jgi:hypothetical protein
MEINIRKDTCDLLNKYSEKLGIPVDMIALMAINIFLKDDKLGLFKDEKSKTELAKPKKEKTQNDLGGLMFNPEKRDISSVETIKDSDDQITSTLSQEEFVPRSL